MARAVQTKPETSTEIEQTRGRPIDLVYLARQTLGDPGLEAEILHLFSEMATSYFERVKSAEDDKDRAIGLHSLKGAALGVGAGTIAAEAAAAETEFRETGAVCAERLSDLGMAIEETRVFISGLLDK